jgi:integrase
MSRRTPYGKWEAVWRIPGPDGNWKQKTKTFLYKREADAYEAKMKAEVKANVYVEPTKDTFAVFLHRWLDNTRPHVAESTQFTYERYIDNYIIPNLGVIKVQNLQPAHIERFLNTMLTSGGKSGKGLSQNTVKIMDTIISAALNDAVERGEIPQSPMVRVPKDRRPKSRSYAFVPLTSEQVQQLVEGTRAYNIGALFLLAAVCGLRLGELAALTWDDIDFERLVLNVDKSLSRIGKRGRQWALGQTKGKEKREVPFTPKIAEALRQHRKIVLQQRLENGLKWQDQNLVFPGRWGAYRSPEGIEARFRMILDRLGLPRVRVHDLRHTAATVLIATGEDPVEVARILGHKDPSLTLKLYAHGTGNRHRIMQKGEELLFGEGD